MTELFKGLEVARKEFNNRHNWQGNAYLYVDFDDMTAWTLTSTQVEYDSKTISRVVFKNDSNARYGKDRLNAILQSLINFKDAGNDIYTDSDDFYRFYSNDGVEAYANGTIIEF